MDLTTIATLITEIGILLGVIIPVLVLIMKIINGQKCQLRSDMLKIYYDNKDTKKIHLSSSYSVTVRSQFNLFSLSVVCWGV